MAGVCTGSNPVTCTAFDSCHVAGTCSPATGVCSNPTSPACGQLFANGDFETGAAGVAPPSWTVHTFINPGLIVTTPQAISDLNLAVGGNALTTIKSSLSGMLSQPDLDLGVAASLRWPRYGNQAVLVNEHSSQVYGNGQNVNTLSQTVTIASGDIDPADNKIHIRFAFAPIFQNSVQAPSLQPYYFILVTNVTQGTVLYKDFNLSGSTVLWKSINTGMANEIDYTDWQLVDVAPADSALKVGDQVELQIVAAGCQLGDHFGEVWVDDVGVTVPGISVEGTGPAQINAGSNITYVMTYRNGAATTEDGVVLTFTTPPLTTFQSITDPRGFTCTVPSVGAAGSVVCTIGTLVPDASGSISVTVNVLSGTPTTLLQRSYSIASTQETTLLGPSITTQVGCTTDSQCVAGNWCNESTSTCTSQLANGAPIPNDPSHSNPTLNGTCTAAASALVCTSGVCDPYNNTCGYANGDGPCTASTSTSVCASGVCDADGKCGLANSDGPCTQNNGPTVCRSGVCDASDNLCGSAVVAIQAIASTSLTQNHAAAAFTPVNGSGGNGTLSYSVSPALPTGLSMASSTGTITGTPTAASSTTSYTVTVTDANNATASATFSLMVNQAPVITSGNSATFTVGAAGSFTVTATGFPTPTVSESGTLPSGVAFNATTGVLSGTPAAGTGGTYNISFTASNGGTPNATQSFTLTINQAPAVATVMLSSSAASVYYGETVTFTTTVTSAAGTPDRSVSFYDGATLLGQASLAGGTASYSAALLSVGGHSVTAVYAGNANFAGATSNARSETVQVAVMVLGAPGIAVTLRQGGSGTTTFTLNSLGSLTGTVDLSCSGLPSGLSCQLSPPSVNLASLPASVTVTVGSTNMTTARNNNRGLAPLGWALAMMLPGVLLVSGARKLRMTTVAIALSLLLLFSLCSCGGSPNSAMTPAGNYTGTITATSPSATSITTSFTVVVQK